MAVSYGDGQEVLDVELGRDSGLFLCTAITEQGMAIAVPVQGKASIEYEILLYCTWMMDGKDSEESLVTTLCCVRFKAKSVTYDDGSLVPTAPLSRQAGR